MPDRCQQERPAQSGQQQQPLCADGTSGNFLNLGAGDPDGGNM